MYRKFITFGDTEIEKHKLHQNKSPISINNIDINEIIRFFLVKGVLNTLLVTKMVKMLELYVYCFQKRYFDEAK